VPLLSTRVVKITHLSQDQLAELGPILARIKSKALRNAVGKIDPELWASHGSFLEELVRPTETDHELRAAFWSAVHLASTRNSGVGLGAIYDGVCTYGHFYYNVLQNPKKLRWLLEPGLCFKLGSRALAHLALDKMHEILLMPTSDKNGKTIGPLISAKVAITDMLLRIHLGPAFGGLTNEDSGNGDGEHNL
jgi:hypothetical protein